MLLHDIPREITDPKLFWVGPNYVCTQETYTHNEDYSPRDSVSNHHDCARLALRADSSDSVYYCECYQAQDICGRRNYHYFIATRGAICLYCQEENHPQQGAYNV